MNEDSNMENKGLDVYEAFPKYKGEDSDSVLSEFGLIRKGDEVNGRKYVDGGK